MIRFDVDTRTLSLSVRDLAGEGDYRFAGTSPVSLKRRALLGRQAHEQHQGARESQLTSYRRERSIRYETEAAGWRAVVTGRIDGIYTDDAGRTVIEEVKTIVGTAADLEAVDDATYPAYTRQLQLYRFLLEEGSHGLAFGDGAPEIALHLHLIALPGREERTVALGYERAECRRHVQARLEALVAQEEVDRDLRAARRARAEEVRFPHPEPRPHQDAMVKAVAAALTEPGRILVSAPPGVGKTAGALVPALRHAWQLGGQVFVATSKTTQQRIFAKTVEALRAAGTPVSAVVLTAREKGCLNGEVDCRTEVCAYARDFDAKLRASGARDRLRALPVVDAESLRAEGDRHEFCPVEAALDLVSDADVVIGDFNYVFDPGAVLRRMFVDREPCDVVLLIDEAHNLHERGCGYYSPVLRHDDIARLERALVGARSPILRRVRDVLARLAALVAAGGRGAPVTALEPEPSPEPEAPPENLLLFGDVPTSPASRPRRAAAKPAARPTPTPPPSPAHAAALVEGEVAIDLAPFAALRDELNELSVAWFVEGRGEPAVSNASGEDPVRVANRLLSRWVGVLEGGGPELSTLARSEAGGTLKVLCKDPSRYLGRRVGACAAAIGISATLQPLEFYRDVLGFGPDAALRAFPCAFDRSRRRVLVLDLPSTAYRQRERDLPIVADAVRAVVGARRGNYIVGCPSFRYMQQLADLLDGVPGYEAIRQARFMPDARRTEVLRRLQDVATRGLPPVLLFAVQGGIFTEGVDYPGEACIGAIIVGPGLPSVGLERSLVQAYFEQTYGRGFEYAFLYPGMSKVVQTAGRVIRTPTDRGVVVLVGSRFATPRYASLFPRDWYASHPRELICGDPYRELLAFWEREE